ncbi:MAG TPA: hypothetical protein VEB42_08330, partial [Chitinophagaceae bacterium]|nr:hypothetical protein [Chitinophagaceae bacterium]
VIFVCNFAFAQQSIPFTDKRWNIQSQGHLLEAFQGYQSMYLQNGEAILDQKFLNGVIEFDVWLTPRASFSGCLFRMTSPGNYEELYFRPHQSGNPDAYQYTPVFNGDPAWQLYHDQFDQDNNGFIAWKPRGRPIGYNGVITYKFNQWLHVKLVVNGTQAELYLDNSNQPAAFIRQLGIRPAAGQVGLLSTAGAAWFANFTVTPMDNAELQTKEPANLVTPPNTIMTWDVSNAFKEDLVKNLTQLDADSKLMDRLAWRSISGDANGIVNLSRVSMPADSANTILVKLSITSDRNQIKRLDLGYSDRVRAYCNGQILYSGTTNFRTRDYRYLGTIGYFDAIYLPLKKGENIIILAVSETFGGWGIMGKMEPDGVRF